MLATPLTLVGLGINFVLSFFLIHWASRRRKLLPKRLPFSLLAIVDFINERLRLRALVETAARRIKELSATTDSFDGLDDAVREPLRRLVEAIVRYNQQVDLQMKALEVWDQQQKRNPGEQWPVLKQVMDVLRTERP
ncbi:MAG: hypothetical protein AAB692_03065, partial [Patescibacteria group bacterium]